MSTCFCTGACLRGEGCGARPAGVTTWPPSTFGPLIQQGWQCPACKGVMSPSMVVCLWCKPQSTVTVTTTASTESQERS